jgi:bifunctional non-homologous end joining protein LigD
LVSAVAPGPQLHQAVPELAALAAALAGCDALLDGELVCLDDDGRPDFHRLRRRLSATDARGAQRLAAAHPATLVIFDVLHLDGRAVRVLPYERRRELVVAHLPPQGRSWRVNKPLSGDLKAVLAVTRARELEGIVAKRLDAPYEPGRRSGAWLKHKHRRRETFAVTGWKPASPGAHRPDAILVGRATADGLVRPAGAVEFGLSGDDRQRLREALAGRYHATRHGVHRVRTGIWRDVDFHGPADRPMRDPVMRALHVTDRPDA